MFLPMKIFYKLCENYTLNLKAESLTYENVTGIVFKNVTEMYENTTSTEKEGDLGAVSYIIVVLLFYSTGIIVMILKYSKTSSKEVEEEMALDIFFKGMPMGKSAEEHNVNNVAIRAFNALTVVDYNHKNGILPRTVLETDV
ncbi:Hypothetical predicted protein [Mytilus galloprovincialis]|uniref:Uncharacterized protein n=2 Tax=Mytilus galloprovincialis TaxID=29158 RepID=A0A8B6GQZ3_MYTGA|nr:Hypothetical predicted protein [Mytilus galloprovincialis]